MSVDRLPKWSKPVDHYCAVITLGTGERLSCDSHDYETIEKWVEEWLPRSITPAGTNYPMFQVQIMVIEKYEGL